MSKMPFFVNKMQQCKDKTMRNKLAKHVADISRCPRQVRDPHVEPRNGGLSPENPSQVGTRVVNIFNMVNIVIRIIIFIMVGCPLKTLHRWGQEVLSLSIWSSFSSESLLSW